MRARSAIALLGLAVGGTGIGSSFLLTGRLFDLAAPTSSTRTVDAAIHALAAAVASSALSISGAKSHIVGTSSGFSTNEATLGPEPLHWHADRAAKNKSDGNVDNVDTRSITSSTSPPPPPFVTDIWDLTINFTDFVQKEAIEYAKELEYVHYHGTDNATKTAPAEKALHWGNMALTGLDLGDGRYLTFSRIWFTTKATPVGQKPGNPNYSYLHTVERDEKMRAIPGTSRIINVPFGPAANEEDCCKGPEDARAFVGPCGSPLLVFNMEVPHTVAKGQLAIKKKIRAMHLYNHSSGDIVQLHPEGVSVPNAMAKGRLGSSNKIIPQLQYDGVKEPTFQKNWVPFLLNRKIHFAYSLAPLHILRLDNPSDGLCKTIYREPENTPAQKLRMGTQFIELKSQPGTFLSLARVVGRAPPPGKLVGGERIYRPVFLLMKASADNKFSITFISGLVLFGERFFLPPFGSQREREGLTLRETNVVVPSGLWKWNEEADEAIFSIYTQDTHNFALRLEGLHAAAKRILSGNSTGLSAFSAINMASEYGRGFGGTSPRPIGGNIRVKGMSVGRSSREDCTDEFSCAFW